MKNFQIVKEDFNRKCHLEDSIKFYNTFNEEFGHVTLFLDKVTREEYLMKLKEFFNEEEFILELRKTINRSNFNHQNLMKFKDYSTCTKNNGKAKKYQIRSYYYYTEQNLKREVKEIKKKYIDFPIEHLTYLFYDMIEACFYLQEKNVSHSNLCPEIILLTNDSFLLGDRMKFKAKYPQNIIDKYIRNNLYISPEFFYAIRNRNSSDIHKIDKFKSDVFVLGMVFLYAGILDHPHIIYDKKKKSIDNTILEKLINAFEGRYGYNKLISIVLRKMLIVDPINRPSFFELKYALPERKSLEKYFLNNRSRKRPVRKIPGINQNINNHLNRSNDFFNQSINNIKKNIPNDNFNNNNNFYDNINKKSNNNTFNKNNEKKNEQMNLKKNILNNSSGITKHKKNHINNRKKNHKIAKNLNDFIKNHPPRKKMNIKQNYLSQSNRHLSLNQQKRVDLQLSDIFDKNLYQNQKKVLAMEEKKLDLNQSDFFLKSHLEKSYKNKKSIEKKKSFNFVSQSERHVTLNSDNINQEFHKNIYMNQNMTRNTSFQQNNSNKNLNSDNINQEYLKNIHMNKNMKRNTSFQQNNSKKNLNSNNINQEFLKNINMNKNFKKKTSFQQDNSMRNLTSANTNHESHKNLHMNKFKRRNNTSFQVNNSIRNMASANTNHESHKNLNMNKYLRRNTSFQQNNSNKNSMDVFGNFEKKKSYSKSPLNSFFKKKAPSDSFFSKKNDSFNHNIYSTKNVTFVERDLKNKNENIKHNLEKSIILDFKKSQSDNFFEKISKEVNYFEVQNTFTQIDHKNFKKNQGNMFKKKKPHMKRPNLSVGLCGNRKNNLNKKKHIPEFKKKIIEDKLKNKNNFLNNSMINRPNPYQSVKFHKRRNSRTPLKINKNLNPPLPKKYKKKNSFQIF